MEKSELEKKAVQGGPGGEVNVSEGVDQAGNANTEQQEAVVDVENLVLEDGLQFVDEEKTILRKILSETPLAMQPPPREGDLVSCKILPFFPSFAPLTKKVKKN